MICCRTQLIAITGEKSQALFAYVSPESFVTKHHPLRPIKKMAGKALAGMDQLFDSIYASSGRSSIPPEKLLKAQLLMILFSIRGTVSWWSKFTTTWSCQ